MIIIKSNRDRERVELKLKKLIGNRWRGGGTKGRDIGPVSSVIYFTGLMPVTGAHNFRYFSNQGGERGEKRLEKKRRNPHRCKEANTCKSRDPYSGHDSNGSTENTLRIIRNYYTFFFLGSLY